MVLGDKQLLQGCAEWKPDVHTEGHVEVTRPPRYKMQRALDQASSAWSNPELLVGGSSTSGLKYGSLDLARQTLKDECGKYSDIH